MAEFDGDADDEEACWGAESKPRSRGRGPASFTHAALHSAWKWLQVCAKLCGLPAPSRPAMQLLEQAYCELGWAGWGCCSGIPQACSG